MDEMMSKLGLGMPDGYLFGFNVRNTLSSVSVGYQDSLAFDALPIPFYCVATDMHTMKEKNWTSGNIVDAMRSTMAIPIYFRPVRTEGMVLSDGGTRNNFPVDIARAMGADIVIGSEMPSSRDLSDLGSIVGIAMQNISMMTTESLDKNRAMTDVLLQHKLEGYNMLSFDSESVDDIIARGYALAQEKGEEFAQVARLVGRQETGPKEKTAVDLRYRKVKVGAVRIEGINDREREYLLLLPAEGPYMDEVVILQRYRDENGEDSYADPEDPADLQAVYNLFRERSGDRFIFSD
jgi:NTE family protein